MRLRAVCFYCNLSPVPESPASRGKSRPVPAGSPANEGREPFDVESCDRSSGWDWYSGTAVQPQGFARAMNKEDQEEKQQRDMFQLVRRIAPARGSSRQVPGGENKLKHKDCGDDGKWTHPQSQHHGNADQQFHPTNRITKKRRMVQREFQERLVEAHCTLLDKPGNPLGVTLMRKLPVHHFVFTKEKEHNAHANAPQGHGGA